MRQALKNRAFGRYAGMWGLMMAAMVVVGGCSESPTAPTNTTPSVPAGSATITAQVASGLQGATSFTFVAQTTNLTASAVAYRWDFGDGTTSTDPSPTRVFPSAGRFTVTLTASDTRQSARAETVVVVHTMSGRWLSSSGLTTMQLTQSGSTVSGTLSTTALSSGTVYASCPISGSVRNVAPVVVLNRPVCRHPTLNQQLVQADVRLDLDLEGQTLSGVIVEPAPFGTNTVNYRRQ